MDVGGQRHAPVTLLLERPGIRYIGGWVGTTASLDGCGKSHPLPPLACDPRTVQPIASGYTD
jgi:hypothetical protein